jgi:hypothetical protein
MSIPKYEDSLDRDTRRSYQLYVVYTFLLGIVVYYMLTAIIPFLQCQFLSWRNRTTALKKTELELETKERELADINAEIARQKQIILEQKLAASKPRQSRQPKAESKFELSIPESSSDHALSFEEVKKIPSDQQPVKRMPPQERYSLEQSASAPSKNEAASSLTAAASPAPSSNITRKPSEYYSRPPLPQPPSMESLSPEHALEEKRREIMRQQDQAYAEAMAADAARMAAVVVEALQAPGPIAEVEEWGEAPSEPNVSVVARDHAILLTIDGPQEHDADVITVVFRFSGTEDMPDMSKAASILNKKGKSKERKQIVRRFLKANTVRQMLAYLRQQDTLPCPASFELVRAYPTLVLSTPEMRDKSIEELGLENNSSLTIRNVSS